MAASILCLQKVYKNDVLQDRSCTRIVSPLVKSFESEYGNAYLSDDIILYMYFVLKIAGSNQGIHKSILEMIKRFTLPRIIKHPSIPGFAL